MSNLVSATSNIVSITEQSIVEYTSTMATTAMTEFPGRVFALSFIIAVILSVIVSRTYFTPITTISDAEVIGWAVATFGPSTILLGISLRSSVTGYWSHAIPVAITAIVGLWAFAYTVFMIRNKKAKQTTITQYVSHTAD
mgnify:CR=1 FL=1